MTAIGPPSLRFALRSIRRTIGYHRLVVVLIALPVLAGVWTAVGMRTVQAGSVLGGSNDRPGGMDAVLLVDPLAPDEVASLVDAIEARGAEAWAVRSTYVASLEAEVVAGDWTGPYQPGVYRVEGVLPSARGEVALTTDLARSRGLGVGDTFQSPSGSPADVVGIVTTRSPWSPHLIYVGPQALAELPFDPDDWGGFSSDGRNSIGILGLDRQEAWAVAEGLGFESDRVSPFEARDTFHEGAISPWSRPEQFGALVTAALLVEAALLAAAAFAVSTSRRFTEVGRLLAIGLTPDQVRRTILAEAALVGAAGAVLGAALAVVAAVVARDALMSSAVFLLGSGALADGLVVGVADVVLPLALAVGGAMAAAWVPARRAAAAPSVAALAGRQVPVPLGTRWLTGSVAAMGTGWVLVWLVHQLEARSMQTYSSGGGWFNYDDGGLLISGPLDREQLQPVLAVGAGLLFLAAVIGLGVAGLELIARRGDSFPLGLRMGAREVRRHRTRTAATVGAIAVLCVLPVGVLTRIASEPDFVRQPVPHPGLALVKGDQTGVWYDVGVDATARPAAAVAISTADLAEQVDARAVPLLRARWADADSAVVADRTGPMAEIAEDQPWIDVWLSPDPGVDTGLGVSPDLDVTWLGPLVVATPELTDALGLPADVAADLARPGTMVQVHPDGLAPPSTPVTGRLYLDYPFFDTDEPSTEVTVVAHPVADLAGLSFGLLVSEANLPPGVVAGTDGWTLLAARSGTFDPAQVAWLNEHHPESVGYVFVQGGQPMRDQLVTLAVVAGLVLVVARVMAGLTAVESDRELTVMASLGAPGRHRQRLLGAQTGLVVGAAVAVAVPLGVTLGWANRQWSLPARQGALDAPWLLVAGLAVLPALAALTVRLTSAEAPAAVSRRVT